MKVYVVELSEDDGYLLYGIYSSLELARNKLKEIYNKVNERYNERSNGDHIEKIVWKGRVNLFLDIDSIKEINSEHMKFIL